MTDRDNKPITPDANLRLYTNKLHNIGGGRTYHRRLVWVVTDHDAWIHGNCAPGKPCPGVPRSEKCDCMVFVDATSGAILVGPWTICPGTPRGSTN